DRAYAAVAFVGAGVTAVVVYLMGSLGGAAPASVKLVLAGAAVTALLTSLTTAVLLVDQQTLEQIRFWLAGSVAGRDLGLFLHLLPFLVVGMLLALLLGKPITTLSLGEDVARGLGQHTGRVKLVAAGSVALLAGSAVAVAGPIGFIGLVIPNAVRPLVGLDYRWILPYSAIAGAILLLVADVAARLVLRPEEMPVGVMTALIGGPVFIYLARTRVGTS
ncbi:MAG: FecCD family ABC transporter permease, partial [Longimicrobiales bacterium]